MKKKAKVFWPKPDSHRLYMKVRRLKENLMYYTDANGGERVVLLDHSRCEPLRQK